MAIGLTRAPAAGPRIMGESLPAEFPSPMSRAAASLELPELQPARAKPAPPPRPPAPRVYDRNFWFCYAANFFMVAAVSSLFRYSDFVQQLGGREQQLGWIVGVGMVGSLSMRLFQGAGIDRYGPRIIWTASLLGFITSCLAQLLLTRVDGPAIYFWRVVYQTSIAGIYGASIAYVSARAPVERLAEVVGTLGTSGFLGMQCGTLLSDLLSALAPLWSLFLGAATLGTASLVCALFGARNAVRHPQHRRLPTWHVLRKYHPGPLLVVAAAMGFGLSLPTVFVRPFAASLQVASISWFFSVYTMTAFGTRLALRRMVDTYGTRLVSLCGLATLIAGMLCFIPIGKPWQFMAPALLIGAAHAMLFPAATAGVSLSFPARYRGLATTLTMAFFDFGAFIASPMAGGLLWIAEQNGWPPYPTMFASVATFLALLAAAYAVSTRSMHRPASPHTSP